MSLKNMIELKKSNRTYVSENFEEVKEAVTQCGGKMVKDIGSAVR
jgi:phage-related protein